MSLSLRLTRASPRLAAQYAQHNSHSNVRLHRVLSTAVRMKDSSKVSRKNPRTGVANDLRAARSNEHGRIGSDKSDDRLKRNRGRRRRGVKPTPPRKLVLPDMGLSAAQLAVLADVSSDAVFRCARELDENIPDSTSLLLPAMVDLIAEELRLNVEVRPQTLPLLSSETTPGAVVEKRMPVVTVMGHVDHGKTSLLDSLRKSDVAKHEVGGITQSVAAFQVTIQTKGDVESGAAQSATFIDTPGHAAFKKMRANGTVATDIVILVVAADDGVMPQTIESAHLARAANVPVIVAVNKCDAPGADPDKVRYELLETLGLNTEQLGGDVQCVDISAKTGQNLPQLLEAISLQAELLALESDPSARATGICLESRVDRAMGSIATVVIRSGTLKQGDHLVFQSPLALRGDLFGHVRGLLDRNGNRLPEAKPGVAVGIIGVREPMPPGAEFCVESNEKAARARSKDILARNAEANATVEFANSLLAKREESQVEHKAQGDKVEETTEGEEEEIDSFNVEAKIRSIIVLIKGDVKGSADAVAQSVKQLGTVQYPIRVLEAGIGDVTKGDVIRVAAIRKTKRNIDESIIIAFNVRVKETELQNARRAGVSILSHNLIYHLEDELKERLEKIHDELKTVEVSLGKAKVLRVFDDGKIGGCSIQDGQLSVGDQANVLRFKDVSSGDSEREVIFSGTVDSIKQFTKSVRSVKKGSECGIGLEGWSAFLSGDQIECITTKKVSEVL